MIEGGQTWKGTQVSRGREKPKDVEVILCALGIRGVVRSGSCGWRDRLKLRHVNQPVTTSSERTETGFVALYVRCL